MYKRILVPLDGSKPGEKSINYAVWLAQKSKAELVLLQVVTGKIVHKSSYLQHTAEQILRRTSEPNNGQPPVKTSIESLSGDPASEILRYINDNEIDIVAMSTHGHSGVKRWLMGSVADRVVRYSSRPVRLVKSFSDDTREYDRNIVVLLDGSEMAEQILPYAVYHAGLSGGELVLLSVCESPDVIPAMTYHLIPEPYPPKRPVQWERYVKEETERREKECRLYLDQYVKRYHQKINIRSEYRFGDAATEITRYLTDNPVDLVAMTTRGRSGLVRWIFGSVAEKVLAISKSPLLILRPS